MIAEGHYMAVLDLILTAGLPKHLQSAPQGGMGLRACHKLLPLTLCKHDSGTPQSALVIQHMRCPSAIPAMLRCCPA